VKRSAATSLARTFVGVSDKAWRFTLTPLHGGSFKLQTLSRGEEFRLELRGHIERNRRPLPGIVRALELLEAGKPMPSHPVEALWLEEWLRAGLIREVRS
jgi:hypothetical protein